MKSIVSGAKIKFVSVILTAAKGFSCTPIKWSRNIQILLTEFNTIRMKLWEITENSVSDEKIIKALFENSPFCSKRTQ